MGGRAGERQGDVVAVLTTAPDREVAERIGGAVVRERLAACANVLPGVTSIYWWSDEVQREGETLMLLKTTTTRVEALRERIVALHPYEVPEVLVLGVDAGHAPYLDWVRTETGGAS